ncbi:hypothetical protein BH11MYX4_BH11MYX4_13850 [soil metagenome]
MTATQAAPSTPPPSARPVSIAEVMSVTPPTIHGDESFSLAHEMMKRLGVRYLPVLDARGCLIGLLSHEDLYVAEAVDAPLSPIDRVSEAMTAAYAVAPGDLVTDVARAMKERGCECAVVIDRAQVVGLFTAADSLSLLADEGPAEEGACP